MQTFLATMLQLTSSQAPQPLYADNATIWHHMSDALHQSLYRVLSLLIAILPGILAFFVALAIFTLIGMLVSALMRRGLRAAKFDDRIAHSRGNADWTPMTSPTALIARASFWGCVLLGLIIGVSAFDTSYATAAALPISLLPYLTHAVGAIFLLIAGTLIARFLARSVLIGAVNAQLQYARFLSLGVKWLVLVLTAAMVLEHLEIGGVVVELAFGILFGGIVLTLSLAVGLGSRDLVSRSLESRVERTGEHNAEPAAPSAGESIRHF
jgi:Mechanosensitive ion channel, conserved TM helix